MIAWGVNGYNDQNYAALGGACIPNDGWNQTDYQFSNPDAWLYDITNTNGWGITQILTLNTHCPALSGRIVLLTV